MKKITCLLAIAMLLLQTTVRAQEKKEENKPEVILLLKMGYYIPTVQISNVTPVGVPSTPNVSCRYVQRRLNSAFGYRTVSKGRSPFGFQGYLNIERLNYYVDVTYDDANKKADQHVVDTTYFAIMLDEGATYDKVTRHNIILHCDAGFDLGLFRNNQLLNIARFGVHAGIGYKFFVVTAGYEQGLKKTSYEGSVNMDMLMSTFTIGLTFYPSVKQLMLLKKK